MKKVKNSNTILLDIFSPALTVWTMLAPSLNTSLPLTEMGVVSAVLNTFHSAGHFHDGI